MGRIIYVEELFLLLLLAVLIKINTMSEYVVCINNCKNIFVAMQMMHISDIVIIIIVARLKSLVTAKMVPCQKGTKKFPGTT